MIAVICRRKNQFDEWLKPWVDKEDYKKFIAVTRDQDMEGLFFSDVIKIGDYWNIRELEELEVRVNWRIRRFER